MDKIKMILFSNFIEIIGLEENMVEKKQEILSALLSIIPRHFPDSVNNKFRITIYPERDLWDYRFVARIEKLPNNNE